MKHVSKEHKTYSLEHFATRYKLKVVTKITNFNARKAKIITEYFIS